MRLGNNAAAMERFSGTLVTDVSSGRVCLRQVQLRVLRGPDEGRVLELSPGSLIVGSHPSVDFSLNDAQVSRRHFEVQLTDDGARIRDLGSKNGTFVGGERVDSAFLPPGHEVLVGESVLMLDADDAPVDMGPGVETFGDLKARSESMRSVFSLLSRACLSDATLLLEGETGVGKDVLARTIHQESPRADGPFLVFDCGAVSPTLIAGELFGHEKGAYTGANTARAGVFEAARGGTVFLDEIGELTLDLQPSLLRLLESRQVRRLGENRARDLDVRVLAATNRDLRAEVDAGRFREDLFFRLAIIKVDIPPLRERKEDLPALVELFLAQHDRNPSALSPADLRRLLAHDWPGNVRELRNTISRSCALSAAGRVSLHMQTAHAPPARAPKASAPARRHSPQSPAPDAAGTMDGTSAVTSAVTNVARPHQEPMEVSPVVAAPRDRPPVAADAVRASAPAIATADLFSLPLKDARAELNARFERAYAERVLSQTGGNVTKAAARAQVARNYLHRLMKRYGLRRPPKAQEATGERAGQREAP